MSEVLPRTAVNMPARLEQACSACGEHHPLGLTSKEREPVVGFEVGEASTDGGLCDTEALRGFSETAALCHRQEESGVFPRGIHIRMAS